MKTNQTVQVFIFTIIAVGALFLYVALSKPGMFNLTRHRGEFVHFPGASQNGSMEATKDTQVSLENTWGKAFKVSGEVWLNGPSATDRYPGDAPDGFSLFLRQTDNFHRYGLNSRLITDKRRLLEGEKELNIVKEAVFPNPTLHEWIPFTAVATGGNIVFKIGQYSGEVGGPLAVDGDNQIDLIAGSKLRNVQLEVLGDAKPD